MVRRTHQIKYYALFKAKILKKFTGGKRSVRKRKKSHKYICAPRQ